MSNYVELAPYEDARVCAGTLDELDRVAAQLEVRLGLRFEQRVRYYWGAQGVVEHCPGSDERGQVQGCADPDDGSVFGPLHVVRHEFAHILGSGIGVTTRVLEEGFAYNAEGICASSMLQSSPSELMAMADEVYEQMGGDTAGTAFVNYFIERFGRESFHEIKRRVPQDAGVGTLDAAVRSELGMTLDELEQQWREEAPLFSCGEPWRWDDEDMIHYSFAPMAVSADLECGSSRTKGPIAPSVVIDDRWPFPTDPVKEGMYADREVTIPIATGISMHLEGPPGATAYLHGHDCWDLDGYDGQIGIRTVELQAGETRVEFFAGCIWRVFLVSWDYEPTTLVLHMEPRADGE